MTFTTSTFVTPVLPSGVCWICYDGQVDRLFVIIHFYELTLKLKPVFLLFLCSFSIFYYSFQCLCATTVSNFKKLILKYLKNVCLGSFKCPNRVWNSPSSSLAWNTLWIQYFRLLLLLLLLLLVFFFFFFFFIILQEGKSHKQWSHPLHNNPYLRL
jgi:hypothetical protein